MARNTFVKVLKNPTNLLQNPTPGAVLGVAALVGLAGWGVYEVTKDETPKKKKEPDGDDRVPLSPLSGVYAENAMLANSSGVVNAARLPISLGSLGAVQLRNKDGDIVTYNTLKLEQKTNGVTANGQVLTGVSWKDTLGRLVTNLTAAATSKAWTSLKADALAGKNLTTVGPQLDQAVLATIKTLAPKRDWSKGLAPYGLLSPEAAVWAGLTLLASIAGQSYKPDTKPADPDGWPTDETLPDDPVPQPLTPAEQAIVNNLTQQLNGRLSMSVQGPASTKYGPDVVVLVDEWLIPDVVANSDAGFSAILGIYEDDRTRATGEHLGIAMYNSKTDNGGFEFRGNKSETIPDATKRIDTLGKKLVTYLASKQSTL